MKYISLFSGIEAASVAWEGLGWEPVCFAELDEFPSAVLAYRYPEVPNVGDVTKAIWGKYKGRCDVVVGGSPCQSFSVAGKREGLRGESGLMYEYIRAVRDIRPAWFLWENVPGALSSEGGEAFRQLLSEMDELGYGMAWRVLDAQFFGVAQRRRRVFLVGHLGACHPAEVLFEPESLRGNLESSAEKRASLAKEAGRSPRSAGFKFHQGAGAGGVGAEPEQSPTLIADWHNPAVYPIDEPITMTDLNANTAIGYDMVGTLKVGGEAPSVCPCGCAGEGKGALVSEVVRRLTPRECERLQGFPDDWTRIPYRGRQAEECPDGPRYKAIGNSMAVPVMRWIGERMDFVEGLEAEVRSE